MKFFTDHALKKITILVGHPDTANTLTQQLALLYETSAKQAGHEVRYHHVGSMRFDPILHKGYHAIQELEPDLKRLQSDLVWCDHLFLIYPNWWCTMPGLLKGIFDRIWLPGFCFNYFKYGWKSHFHFWKPELQGKTARVVVLSGTHPLLIWLMFGDYTNEIKRGILWFAGFKVRLSRLGPSEIAPEWKKNEWRQKMVLLGKLGE